MIQQIESGVINLLLLLIVVGIGILTKHVKSFVVTHTNEKQRTLVQTLVNDAVPYIQTLYPQANPTELIQKAADHVTSLAIQKGITVNQQEVNAATAAILTAVTPTPVAPATATPAQ